MSEAARVEAGVLLRKLQQGQWLSLPQSRPMPSIGSQCHELRINDVSQTWRILYRIDPDVILVLEIFSKKTPSTPQSVIENCKRRLNLYEAARETEKANG